MIRVLKLFVVSLLTAVFVSGPLWAVEMGDDGLHKTPWMRDTFKDLGEDLAEANALGLRLMVLIEQRGCIYCTRMHEEVFPLPDVQAAIMDNFYVVQVNMFGDVDVTDFDGTVMSEKEMVRRWNVLFTPTILFLPTEVPVGTTASDAAVATMPGAFDHWTTLNMLNWVVEDGYAGDETFQRYHARRLLEEGVIQ